MTNSTSPDISLSAITSLVHNFRDDLTHPTGLIQIGAIVASYLVAWLLATEIRKFLEKDIEKVKAHIRFVLSPTHFAVILKWVFWLLLLWFCQVLFKRFTIPTNLLPATLNIIIVLLVIRFATFYIKSTFWSRFAYVMCVVVGSLRIFKLWDPTVQLLNSMTIGLGKISISVWGLTEAIIVFILLLAAAGVANRFIAHWLTTYTHLTYSDRTLLQRIIKAAMVMVVIMISLKAAGIHMAAVVVTGGQSALRSASGCKKSVPI
jgi:small-conductance mechanosensitive channel